MGLHERPVGSLTSDHVRGLLAAAIPEGKTLEYKQELPGNSDSEKKEFLADVTSFANAAGGLILYGITTSNGIPEAVPGFPNKKMDPEVLRFEAILRSGIAERIPGLRAAVIPVSPTHSVVAIRVPRSLAGPHMVTFKGSSRFFGRDSRGKYQMDIGEIRAAFAANSSIAERIRKFRLDRVAAIGAREISLKLTDGPATIVHVVPFEAVAGVPLVDISTVDPATLRFSALGSGRYDLTRYNFEGLAVTSPEAGDSGVHAYAQLFREGAIEAINASMIYPESGQSFIRSTVFETTLIDAVAVYVTVLSELGLSPPFAIMVSLTSVKGYRVLPVTQNRHWDSFGLPLDRDTLLLPEVIVYAEEIDSPGVLRPVFDTLWQSAGWERSMNYDATDRHVPSQSRN